MQAVYQTIAVCIQPTAGINPSYTGKHARHIGIEGIYIFLGCALVGGISYLLQLIGAQNLPATILYPFITGGCIIVTALAGWLLYHEKLSKQTILGIALCFAGTCMFL